MSAKFDEFPSLPFQHIKEKPKSHRWMDGRTDNVKTVYPPTNIVCRGYNETTIANCYTKAGFKTTDNSATNPSAIITDSTHLDDDPLDDLSLARLVGANITMNDYVSVDDNVPTCEDISDDTIVDDIITVRDNRPGDDDEDDDHANTANAAPVDPPSADMALKACETLILFLQQQSNLTDAYIAQKESGFPKGRVSSRCNDVTTVTNIFFSFGIFSTIYYKDRYNMLYRDIFSSKILMMQPNIYGTNIF